MLDATRKIAGFAAFLALTHIAPSYGAEWDERGVFFAPGLEASFISLDDPPGLGAALCLEWFPFFEHIGEQNLWSTGARLGLGYSGFIPASGESGYEPIWSVSLDLNTRLYLPPLYRFSAAAAWFSAFIELSTGVFVINKEMNLGGYLSRGTLEIGGGLGGRLVFPSTWFIEVSGRVGFPYNICGGVYVGRKF